MIVLASGDSLRGSASVAAVVDFSFHGLNGAVIDLLAEGQLPVADGALYPAAAIVVVKSMILVNTHSAAVSINLTILKSGSTARRLIPKDMSLGIGFSLYFDGSKLYVINASGEILNVFTATAHATSHVTGGSDVVANAVPAGNAGLMTGTDKTKLNGIETGATADQSQADINALAITAVGTLTSGNADAVVTKATAGEINTGTEAVKVNTPDALAGSIFGTKNVVVKCIEDATALSVADGKAYFTVPIELNGMNLVSVGAHVYTVSSSGLPTFQIHNLTDVQDMLSTLLTIDAGEKDSKDAVTPAVINTTYDDVATGDELRFDCDVAGTGTLGMEIRMGFRLP